MMAVLLPARKSQSVGTGNSMPASNVMIATRRAGMAAVPIVHLKCAVMESKTRWSNAMMGIRATVMVAALTVRMSSVEMESKTHRSRAMTGTQQVMTAAQQPVKLSRSVELGKSRLANSVTMAIQ
jgi:hypothetical protein